jgi:UDP-N-acetylglucosamine--N-acetylmuramyl-(pentapeptide) pyrophosphoryl-undecaprenol N-acetylglucosamine transferase
MIAGGGTGGHIFPAIAIANALRKIDNSIEILFVGAKGRMEMEKVPQAGYRIEGIDIAGLNRSSLIKNIGLPFKLLKSFLQVRGIFKRFKPDAVIGVGGYSSFPVLRTAQGKGLPNFLLESNSFAGKSNKLLSRKATKIFAGMEGLDKFFPADKIIVTGNPVRAVIANSQITREEGLKFFSMDTDRRTLLVVGGSLGAKSINEAVNAGLDKLIASGMQVIWQTGKPYASIARDRCDKKMHVWVNEFITQMEYAYAAADIVVARAGAMTVAELCVAKKPVLFVPYPFAAEDHQTVNAMQLVDRKAAIMVSDNKAAEKLVDMTIELSSDREKQEQMKQNISQMAVTNADEKIAQSILKIIR